MLFLPIMLLLVTASVNAVATPTATLERCLRLRLNPPPPPPPNSESPPRLNIIRIICKDSFRSVGYFLRSTGKLPLDYVVVLCHIFHHNEQTVAARGAHVPAPRCSHAPGGSHVCHHPKEPTRGHTLLFFFSTVTQINNWIQLAIIHRSDQQQ